MFGTIVNSVAIMTGGIIGVMLKKGLSESYKETIMDGVSLSIIVIGIMNAIKSENIILLISSLVIGAFVGESIGIEKKIDNLGNTIESKMKKGEHSFAKGFVTSSLVFCVGAMAIIGSLEAGIQGNFDTLYAKSIVEGVSALVFATTMGTGVIFSAIPVFIYQGIITMLAGGLNSFLTPSVINEISAVGGVLIIGIGISILGLKQIKVGNLLPSIIVPLIYFMVINIMSLI